MTNTNAAALPPEIPPVAIFHLSVKTISRSAGRSATAAIAYRVGERIVDERSGLVHDYSRKRGIEHTELFLPANSPIWAVDRSALWNAAEQAEKRKNSTVAREFEVAMPAELGKAERLELVREFAAELVKRHGMAVDIAIHEPGKDGDHRNHHAHILCSTRRLTLEGFTEKTRELDDQKSGEVVHWRTRWAEISNRHLENAGSQERVDHRSLVAQQVSAVELGQVDQAAALKRMPTVHMGPKVVKMEQRGICTNRGDENRAARHYNSQVIDLAEVRKRIEAAKVEQAEQASAFLVVQRELTPASLGDVLKERNPIEAANDAAATAALSPERVKAEWKTEKAKQFTLIVHRAQKAQARAAGMVERQVVKLANHDKAQPRKPTGLFAGFRKGAHDQALSAWNGVRVRLEKRWGQLEKRLRMVGDYLRKTALYEPGLSKGEMLAQEKATQARPELARTFRQVVEKEKAAAIQAVRDKAERSKQIKQEQSRMKAEKFEFLKTSMDERRKKAEKAERAELEKAGLLADRLKTALEKEESLNPAIEPTVEKLAQARRAQLELSFKEKARKDRDSERENGRGR